MLALSRMAKNMSTRFRGLRLFLEIAFAVSASSKLLNLRTTFSILSILPHEGVDEIPILFLLLFACTPLTAQTPR